MTIRKALTVGALIFGGVLGSTNFSVASEGNQQCYYRPGTDVENSCTACADTCGGAGYRCCTIIG
ncbi:hypothetical protein [Longimicrobium sp.]|jgi:hypothetical protein|uniref:hypothetical protein n=1 Tax=Longimicrobium sp. TaxID=2029185 RepID=UPI002EDA669D